MFLLDFPVQYQQTSSQIPTNLHTAILPKYLANNHHQVIRVYSLATENQPSPPKPTLCLEHTRIGNSHLQRFMAATIKAAPLVPLRELNDLTPFETGSLDIVRVEEGGGGAVEVGQLCTGLDAAVED